MRWRCPALILLLPLGFGGGEGDDKDRDKEPFSDPDREREWTDEQRPSRSGTLKLILLSVAVRCRSIVGNQTRRCHNMYS